MARAASSGAAQLASMLQSKGKLALEKVKLANSVPSQHEFTAEAFSKAGENIDNRETSGAILKGLLDGLAIGQKSKAAAEKEARVLQQQQLIEQMEADYDKVIAAEQKAVTQQQAREALLPSLMGYIQAAPTLGADGRRGNMQQLIDAYNRRTESKFELVSIDAQNPTLVTIKDGETGEVQAIDLPAMFAPDNPEINSMMGSMYPTYQREQAREDQRLAIQQAHLGVAQSKEAREQQQFDLERAYSTPGQKSESKPIAVLTPGERNQLAKQHAAHQLMAQESDIGLRILGDMRKVEKEAQEAGIDLSTPLNRVDSRYGGVAMSKKSRSILKQYEKLNSLLGQSQIRGLGKNATDSAKELVKQGLPTADLPAEARLKAIETKEREFNINILREEYFTEQLNSGLVPTERGFRQYLKESQGAGALQPANANPQGQQDRQQKLQELQRLDALIQQRGGR